MGVSFDAEGKFIRCLVTGELTFDDFVRSFQEIVTHPEFRPGMDVLWDFHGASMARMDQAMLRRIASHLREREHLRRGARVAVVVTGDADYGIIRMYEAIADTPAETFRIFRTLAEAERWLRADRGGGGSEPPAQAG